MNDHLKVISSNDDIALEKNRQKDEAENAAGYLRQAVVELAANLMRISAGAGKDFEVIGQVVRLFEAYQGLRGHSGSSAYPYAPHAPISEALRDMDWRAERGDYTQSKKTPGHSISWDGERWHLEQNIARASLRLVAAQLLGQATQESNADNLFHEAIWKWNDFSRKEGYRVFNG